MIWRLQTREEKPQNKDNSENKGGRVIINESDKIQVPGKQGMEIGKEREK